MVASKTSTAQSPRWPILWCTHTWPSCFILCQSAFVPPSPVPYWPALNVARSPARPDHSYIIMKCPCLQNAHMGNRSPSTIQNNKENMTATLLTFWFIWSHFCANTAVSHSQIYYARWLLPREMSVSVIHHLCIASPCLCSCTPLSTVPGPRKCTMLEHGVERLHCSIKLWLKCAWVQYRWPSGSVPLGAPWQNQ